MTTSRQRLMDYMQRLQVVSAREIARDLNVTAANARHHLTILEADGRVQVVGKRKLPAGPPEKLFALANLRQADNVAVLLDIALDLWLQNLSVVEQEQALHRLAVLLGEKIEKQNGTLQKKIAHLIAGLNSLNYQARWEAAKDGPRVILGQCPYAALVHRRPELCQIDLSLLEHILDRPVEQIAKQERTERGLSQCVFLVK